MKKTAVLYLIALVSITPSANAQPLTANNVRYHSASGLRTSEGRPTATVQEALDSLSSSVSQLIGGRSGHKTKWAGTVYDVLEGAFRKSTVSVTFEPSSDTQGTWTSSPFDVFSPSEQLAGQGPQGVSGTWTGHYNIAGDMILASNIQNPDAVDLGVGRTSLASAKGAKLEIIETSSTPSTVVILQKQ